MISSFLLSLMRGYTVVLKILWNKSISSYVTVVGMHCRDVSVVSCIPEDSKRTATALLWLSNIGVLAFASITVKNTVVVEFLDGSPLSIAVAVRFTEGVFPIHILYFSDQAF